MTEPTTDTTPDTLWKGRRSIEVPLSDHDLADNAKESARLGSLIDDLSGDRKQIGDSIKDAKSGRARIDRNTREGTKEITVDCVAVAYGGTSVRIIRVDTDEVVEERAMTDVELQGQFSFATLDTSESAEALALILSDGGEPEGEAQQRLYDLAKDIVTGAVKDQLDKVNCETDVDILIVADAIVSTSAKPSKKVARLLKTRLEELRPAVAEESEEGPAAGHLDAETEKNVLAFFKPVKRDDDGNPLPDDDAPEAGDSDAG